VPLLVVRRVGQNDVAVSIEGHAIARVR
jgi:hypothetical protein